MSPIFPSRHRLQAVALLCLSAWTVLAQNPAPAPATAPPPAVAPAPVPTPPPVAAPAPAPSTGLQARGLAEFGPVTTPTQVQETFRKALDELTAAKGGVLVIPETVPAGVNLENTARWSKSLKPESNDLRDWQMGPGVMVLDTRNGTYRLRVPQLSDKNGSGGLIVNRTMRLPPGNSLQHWTRESVISIENNIVHGPVNYLDWLTADTEPGPDARFYVPLPHNLFKGMYLNAHSENGYGGAVERITVKDIGWDAEKKSYYFTAHANKPHKAGAIVQNKSHTPALHVLSRMNASNQTFDVYVERQQYGNGDSYMFDAIFGYMGNVHSMAGDENGACYVAYIKSLTNIFRGTVRAYDAAKTELVFSGTNASTLGHARPIINLNPAKWVTAGTVMIVPAESWWDLVDTGKYPFEGKTYPTTLGPARGSNNRGLRMGGLIRGSAECPWDASLIGRYFAVDEPTEYVPKTDKVRRWYEITGVTILPDGRKDLLIQRLWWGAKDAGAPTLYNPDNHSYDGHLRPLKYIIAPGAMVQDLSRAVGSNGEANGIAPFTLAMTPSSVSGTPQDFAPGDAIEQAIGPDPFKPQALRAWSFDAVPGAWPGATIDLANFGVARASAITVQGGPTTLAAVANTAEKRPTWDHAFVIATAVGVGLDFRADVSDAAIRFRQPGVEQPIKWQYGPRDVGKPVAEATLKVSNSTGDLVYQGGDVRLSGSLLTGGLSASETPARNLRGKGVVVAAGTDKLQVSFPKAEADADYAVFIEQNWLTQRAIISKEATGFTVQFERPAPAQATLDWLLVR